MEVTEVGGVWRLAVETASGREALRYDDAHRRLASTLGWAAMPSPPHRIVREAGGFRGEGFGLGHRVGLCIGVDAPGASADATVGAPR
jgi:hypothetical protein